MKNADHTDGIRITGSGGWILIRPSGTEPYIRITAEGRDEKPLERWSPRAGDGWMRR